MKAKRMQSIENRIFNEENEDDDEIDYSDLIDDSQFYDDGN